MAMKMAAAIDNLFMIPPFRGPQRRLWGQAKDIAIDGGRSSISFGSTGVTWPGRQGNAKDTGEI
jgi:hypothetical protein